MTGSENQVIVLMDEVRPLGGSLENVRANRAKLSPLLVESTPISTSYVIQHV